MHIRTLIITIVFCANLMAAEQAPVITCPLSDKDIRNEEIRAYLQHSYAPVNEEEDNPVCPPSVLITLKRLLNPLQRLIIPASFFNRVAHQILMSGAEPGFRQEDINACLRQLINEGLLIPLEAMGFYSLPANPLMAPRDIIMISTIIIMALGKYLHDGDQVELLLYFNISLALLNWAENPGNRRFLETACCQEIRRRHINFISARKLVYPTDPPRGIGATTEQILLRSEELLMTIILLMLKSTSGPP